MKVPDSVVWTGCVGFCEGLHLFAGASIAAMVAYRRR